MLTVAQALENILGNVGALTPAPIPLERCLGRRLAEPVQAGEDQPSFASSAMDGYAVCGSASEYRLVGEVAAGQVPERPLLPGECVRIFTGAMLPEGTGAVVPQEDCRREADRMWPQAPVEPGQHLRPAGEHCRRGETLLSPGRLLGAADVGLAALLGRASLSCWPRPRVAVLSTGDELVELDRPLGPAQVRNSNAYALQAQIESCAAQAWRHPIVPDRPELVAEAVQRCLADSDLLVTCGGASVGDRDYIQAALRALGADLQLWKVAMRPGKPLGFAMLGGKPVVALPGNPVSSFVTFELFVRPLLDLLQGGGGQGLRRGRFRLGQDVTKKRGLRFFLRCRLEQRGTAPSVVLCGGQGSHLFRSVAESIGLLELAEEREELQAGEIVEVLMWPWVSATANGGYDNPGEGG